MTYGVIGAGMVGCATALSLHQRGHKVVIYEQRPDPRRQSSQDVGRSINLALSARGLLTLREFSDKEMKAAIDAELMPMHGRMLHSKTGDMAPVSYGISGEEAINSIGRSTLNNILIDACRRAGIEIKFNARGPTHLDDLNGLNFSTTFGCDGTFSKVRGIVMRHTDSKLEMETVSTYYVEIPMPKAPTWSDAHLHIWPRGTHMLIGLPNPSGTFTGTLFAPREIFNQFNSAKPELFLQWFKEEFADAAQVLGDESLLSIGSTRNWGKLTNVKCSPYNLDDRVVLLGDAAHSMVPFYGQGLNTGLEDVRILFTQFIDKNPGNLKQAFENYGAFRKPDCDAIVNLSIANYEEMRSSVATRMFKLRKQLDNFLANHLGDLWLPLYTMVSFRPDIRYSDALASSRWQQRLIDRLLKITGITVLGLFILLAKYAKRRS